MFEHGLFTRSARDIAIMKRKTGAVGTGTPPAGVVGGDFAAISASHTMELGGATSPSTTSRQSSDSGNDALRQSVPSGTFASLPMASSRIPMYSMGTDVATDPSPIPTPGRGGEQPPPSLSISMSFPPGMHVRHADTKQAHADLQGGGGEGGGDETGPLMRTYSDQSNMSAGTTQEIGTEVDVWGHVRQAVRAWLASPLQHVHSSGLLAGGSRGGSIEDDLRTAVKTLADAAISAVRQRWWLALPAVLATAAVQGGGTAGPLGGSTQRRRAASLTAESLGTGGTIPPTVRLRYSRSTGERLADGMIVRGVPPAQRGGVELVGGGQAVKKSQSAKNRRTSGRLQRPAANPVPEEGGSMEDMPPPRKRRGVRAGAARGRAAQFRGADASSQMSNGAGQTSLGGEMGGALVSAIAREVAQRQALLDARLAAAELTQRQLALQQEHLISVLATLDVQHRSYSDLIHRTVAALGGLGSGASRPAAAHAAAAAAVATSSGHEMMYGHDSLASAPGAGAAGLAGRYSSGLAAGMAVSIGGVSAGMGGGSLFQHVMRNTTDTENTARALMAVSEGGGAASTVSGVKGGKSGKRGKAATNRKQSATKRGGGRKPSTKKSSSGGGGRKRQRDPSMEEGGEGGGGDTPSTIRSGDGEEDTVASSEGGFSVPGAGRASTQSSESGGGDSRSARDEGGSRNGDSRTDGSSSGKGTSHDEPPNVSQGGRTHPLDVMAAWSAAGGAATQYPNAEFPWHTGGATFHTRNVGETQPKRRRSMSHSSRSVAALHAAVPQPTTAAAPPQTILAPLLSTGHTVSGGPGSFTPGGGAVLMGAGVAAPGSGYAPSAAALFSTHAMPMRYMGPPSVSFSDFNSSVRGDSPKSLMSGAASERGAGAFDGASGPTVFVTQGGAGGVAGGPFAHLQHHAGLAAHSGGGQGPMYGAPMLVAGNSVGGAGGGYFLHGSAGSAVHGLHAMGVDGKSGGPRTPGGGLHRNSSSGLLTVHSRDATLNEGGSITSSGFEMDGPGRGDDFTSEGGGAMGDRHSVGLRSYRFGSAGGSVVHGRGGAGGAPPSPMRGGGIGASSVVSAAEVTAAAALLQASTAVDGSRGGRQVHLGYDADGQ